MYENKKILFGITGSIAAYKACELLRELINYGVELRVVMTEAGTKFVAPLTFETLTGRPVITSLFPNSGDAGTLHIEAARWSDALVICPATANFIAKASNGIADDALSTIFAATTAPVLFCPAMNKEMYAKATFKENRKRLLKLGYRFVDSAQGSLACGEEGWGRLADNDRILGEIKRALFGSRELNGLNVLVTAGRTEEDIDPIRYITNRSSGKMGFALAEAAIILGADVSLISGPSAEKPFPGVSLERVRSASEMAHAVKNKLKHADVLVMAAAVADFRPERYHSEKIKKNAKTTTLKLSSTDDILAAAGRQKASRVLVGFAMETENELENARAKLRDKNLDLIVMNNPAEPDAGFGSEFNKVTIIDREENLEELPTMSKYEIARRIWLKVAEIARSR